MRARTISITAALLIAVGWLAAALERAAIRVSRELVTEVMMVLTLPNAEDGEVEVGWHLHPDSWGHGYATEAATAVIQHGFDAGLPEVYAITHTTNERSQAVCRRLGLDDLGVMEKWYDEESRVYRTTPARWADRA